MSVRITGLNRALTRLARLPAAAREARDEVLEQWAEDTQDTAKNLVPERTGNLNNAIDKRVFSDAAYVGVYKPDELEYAEYVEKGTSSMEEQPYLVPAFEANRADVARNFRAAIRRRTGA
ncbi:HK97-gp10 family putative phage morphogenesis protein [Streptomyces albidoflavus]|uniref:HK97-gp10 family putative phage morphogenesis protein n=1 Tax=Streptomyces albidoflavus TaxID=1886 RepID=UPI0033CFF961